MAGECSDGVPRRFVFPALGVQAMNPVSANLGLLTSGVAWYAATVNCLCVPPLRLAWSAPRTLSISATSTECHVLNACSMP